MKVAITGHTSGIGLALASKFQTVKGFSRSNGYNLCEVDKILTESEDCDIFVNNAYNSDCPWSQVELLYKKWFQWENEQKLIVNISSNSNDQNKSKPQQYTIHKSSLDQASKQLSYLNKSCRILNVRPGYVDTPRVKNISENKINTFELAQLITSLLDYKSLKVSEITILPL